VGRSTKTCSTREVVGQSAELVVRSRQKHPMRSGKSAHKIKASGPNHAALPAELNHKVMKLLFLVIGLDQLR
jgi:hypothetical protein